MLLIILIFIITNFKCQMADMCHSHISLRASYLKVWDMMYISDIRIFDQGVDQFLLYNICPSNYKEFMKDILKSFKNFQPLIKIST